MPTAPPRKSGSDRLSGFAYVDSEGKGRLPLNKNGKLDAGHVRNALARFNQTHFESESAKAAAKATINAAAKRLGIKVEQSVARGTDAPEFQFYGPAVELTINAEQQAAGKAPDWIEVIPAGTFKGRDGRGPFNNANPQAVVDATAALNMTAGIPVDYDHATDFAAPEGREAPAAGWMREFQVRNGAIWARVEWTPKGAQHVAHKEWAYVSPVFEHTKDDQQIVTRLLRAALTNNPNLELQAVAAAAGRRTIMAKKGSSLAEQIAALEAAFPDLDEMQLIQMLEKACALKDPAGAADAERTEDLDRGDETEIPSKDAMCVHGNATETCAECRQAADGEADTYAREIRGDGEEPTDDEKAAAHKFLAAHRKVSAAKETKPMAKAPDAAKMAALKQVFPDLDDAQLAVMVQQAGKPEPGTDARDETIKSLNTKVVALETKDTQREASLKVEAAMRFPNPKISPAMRTWAIDYAMRDPKGFDAYLKTAPVIMAKSPDDLSRPPEKGTDVIDARTREICQQMGVKPEDFAKKFEAEKGIPGTGAAMMARHAAQ